MNPKTSTSLQIRCVAYLAPEIPALSATFVYEEIHALERRGFTVVPFAVHRAANLATEQRSIASRTTVVYSGSPLKNVLTGMMHVTMHVRGLNKAIGWLYKDIAENRSLRSTGKLVYQFLAAAKLASCLKHRKCAHLHIHFAHVPAQIGMYASALAQLPFTVTAHANDIFERGFLLKNKADRALKIFCISDFNRQFLLSLGLPEAKLTVVRCGVSFPVVEKGPASLGRTFHIGTLGRLVEKKGIDVLLRSVAQLHATYQNFELSIAGDGPLRDELKAQVYSLGLTDCVRFEGALTHERVADWMDSLDLFVLACKVDSQGDMDGIPVVLMEAMSQSIPVVSTRLSGIPELIVHEKTGLLAEPGDSTDLATQILRMMEDTSMRNQVVRHARTHVAREFSQDTNIDRLIDQAALR